MVETKATGMSKESAAPAPREGEVRARAREGWRDGELWRWWDGGMGWGGYVVVMRLRAFDGLDDDVREDRDGDSERG